MSGPTVRTLAARVAALEQAVTDITEARASKAALELELDRERLKVAELALCLTGVVNELARIGGYDPMVIELRETMERLGGGS